MKLLLLDQFKQGLAIRAIWYAWTRVKDMQRCDVLVRLEGSRQLAAGQVIKPGSSSLVYRQSEANLH